MSLSNQEPLYSDLLSELGRSPTRPFKAGPYGEPGEVKFEGTVIVLTGCLFPDTRPRLCCGSRSCLSAAATGLIQNFSVTEV